MLRPVIMIGCGGSGQKAVRYVRDAVSRRLLHINWEGGFPESWQFLGIDTLSNQEDPSIPYLPANDYISVSLNYTTYANLAAALDAKFPPESEGFKEMRGWRPKPNEVQVPLQDGAGQLRAVGRAAGVLALKNKVQPRLKNAFSACASGGPVLAEISQRLGVNVPPGTPVPEPLTIVVGSMAGGTGAGIMLDVVDLIRRTDKDGAFPVMVAFTPDIFGSFASDQMTANSAAFVSEFLSAYWDDEGTDSALVPPLVEVGTRGPHSTFMVGRRNMEGLDLGNSKNVYRAVGEALAAVTTSGKVQTQFRNFITTNWENNAPTNGGGFGWHNDLMKGALSSFGSTTLSIGRDRFREYISKLLHRTIVEFLSEGFNEVAASVIGQEAKSMASQSKIAELARLNREQFMTDCSLSERGGHRQITAQFVGQQLFEKEVTLITSSIRSALPNVKEQPVTNWLQQIKATAQSAQMQSQLRATQETPTTINSWGSDLFVNVLQTCTAYSSRLSIPVVMNLLEFARSELLELAGMLKQAAGVDSESKNRYYQQAQSYLAGSNKASISISNTNVTNTISDFSRAIAHEWSQKVKEQLSVAVEAVSTGMINSILAALQQSLNRLAELLSDQDGQEAAVASWPKNDQVVPELFAPSPVEFFLEEHSTWPQTAKALLDRSIGEERSKLAAYDPVDAARIVILQGGFSEGLEETVPPMIWATTYGGSKPRWSPGQPVAVEVGNTVEEISNRIEAWLKRPATEINRFLREGLSDYLSPLDRNRMPIPNHPQRLSIYKQKLQEALSQSRPLMEIDTNIYPTVHRMECTTSLNVQGFPFGESHPAREITLAVVQGFQKDSASDLDLFTSGETESVLISSFLDYPVNPSVVSSFTRPLTESMTNVDPETLRSSFWLWRRARVLENFIPLPDKLRLAAIRGFAIARTLGLCTAVVKEGNRIIDSEGIHEFPRHLLTNTDRDNLLPALLEAMILSFADAPTRGKSAFSAYGSLISYGVGGGLVDLYELPNVLTKFLNDGEFVFEPLDPARKADVCKASNDFDAFESRKSNVLRYLNTYIKSIEEIQAAPTVKTYWRDKSGAVDPTNTLRLELSRDIMRGYTDVKKAVEKYRSESEETVS